METHNVIYAYKKRSSQKIVYVGQTVDLATRHKQHMKYDPFNQKVHEYNYPLSRGVRKYGADEYELIILEDNLLREELNEREKYWISYYNTYFNGYNQSTGGANPVKPILSEDVIDVIIEMLRDESFSYKDIIERTGVSMTHISNINLGNRRKRDNLTYPIRQSNTKGTRGLKFSPDECLNIHQMLKNTRLSIKELAGQFNCSTSTISDINYGRVKAYHLNDWVYPIRK